LQKIIVETQPKGKARPRFARVGKFVHTYTPKATVDYESLFAWEWQKNHYPLFKNALKVHITAYFEPLKSDKKSLKMQKINNKVKHIHKPDIDNIIKAVLDGLNGVAYKDDNQVVELVAFKRYAEKQRIEVEIIEVLE
jgi:Holliday junction resolvase RusA-like endonuclease